MSKPSLRDVSDNLAAAPEAYSDEVPVAERRPADLEMARVLKTAPLRMASDPSSGSITFWRHDPLHDVVAPMADHVIMAFPAGPVRFERRDGKTVVSGMTRPATVTVIPAGSTS